MTHAYEKVVMAAAAQLMTTEEEFEQKVKNHPERTRRIAYYLEGTGYSMEDALIDQARMITTLYDFLAFTDDADWYDGEIIADHEKQGL